jgi:hypothetical protein
LTQYFFFQARSNNKLHRIIIDDAEGLWESFKKIYNLDGSLVNLETSLPELLADNPNISYFHFGSLTNPDETVSAHQLLVNDVLVLSITISTPEDYKTETPESDWEEQLDIAVTARDLTNILGTASVLQTGSENYNEILMSVRMKMDIAKNQMIHYSNLDFGHFYRFGKDDNYLLVLDLPQNNQEQFNNFLLKELPYLLTLNLLIRENHRLYDNAAELITDLDHQMEQHIKELPKIKKETDPIMLAIRKDHVSELEKKAKNLLTEIRNNADQIDMNLAKLLEPQTKLKTIIDAIFVDDVKSFQEYKNDIMNWLSIGEGIYPRISAKVEDYTNQIAGIIQSMEPSVEKEKGILGRPKFYTPKQEIGEFSIDTSPYKSAKDGLSHDIEKRTELIESIPLEWCSSYILLEQNPGRSLKIFSDLVNDRFLGLVITKKELEALIEQYKFKDTEMYQLSDEPGDKRTPPILSKIAHIINDFLNNNIHSIIFLEGLDYLAQVNDFKRVLQFNNNIKESIVLNDSILLISMKASDFDNEQLKQIMENSINISDLNVEFEDIL